jgi:hypothetical protein
LIFDKFQIDVDIDNRRVQCGIGQIKRHRGITDDIAIAFFGYSFG